MKFWIWQYRSLTSKKIRIKKRSLNYSEGKIKSNLDMAMAQSEERGAWEWEETEEDLEEVGTNMMEVRNWRRGHRLGEIPTVGMLKTLRNRAIWYLAATQPIPLLPSNFLQHPATLHLGCFVGSMWKGACSISELRQFICRDERTDQMQEYKWD